LSSALQGGTAAYSYKVDSYKLQAERFRNELVRRSYEPEPEIEILPFGFPPIVENSIDERERALQLMPLANRLSDQSINVSNLEARFDMDPFYERSKRDFSEGAVKNLLVNTLEVISRLLR
jgi:hypothetical protein